MTEYGKGVLYDLSSRGALFASERDLVIDTQIHFVVPAENAQTPGVEVFATISRKTFYPTRKRKFETAASSSTGRPINAARSI
jgi:hypothetical protein